MNDPAARHPAFAPYRRWWSGGALPDLAALNAAAQERAIASTTGAAIRFVDERARGALAYERAVAERGTVATRAGSPHDVFNALAWLAFPRTKAALNARHVAEGRGRRRERPQPRARRRDAARRVGHRARLRRRRARRAAARARMAAAVRRPARRRAARDAALRRRARAARQAAAPLSRRDRARADRAGRLSVVADETAGAARPMRPLRRRWRGRAHPAQLVPVPVAAFPGWDSEGLGERLFDDRSVFRELGSEPRNWDGKR